MSWRTQFDRPAPRRRDRRRDLRDFGCSWRDESFGHGREDAAPRRRCPLQYIRLMRIVVLAVAAGGNLLADVQGRDEAEPRSRWDACPIILFVDSAPLFLPAFHALLCVSHFDAGKVPLHRLFSHRRGRRVAEGGSLLNRIRSRAVSRVRSLLSATQLAQPIDFQIETLNSLTLDVTLISPSIVASGFEHHVATVEPQKNLSLVKQLIEGFQVHGRSPAQNLWGRLQQARRPQGRVPAFGCIDGEPFARNRGLRPLRRPEEFVIDR